MWSLSEYNKAGRSPGVRTLDILDNIIPFIPKEEAKVNKELLKILGEKSNDQIIPANIHVNCICTRANVLDGHTESVFVGLKNKPDLSEVKRVLAEHNPLKALSF